MNADILMMLEMDKYCFKLFIHSLGCESGMCVFIYILSSILEEACLGITHCQPSRTTVDLTGSPSAGCP